MKKDKRDKLLNSIHKLITIDNNYNENAHFIFKVLSDYAKIMQEADERTIPLSGSNYATLQTNDLLTVRNIISEMEK